MKLNTIFLVILVSVMLFSCSEKDVKEARIINFNLDTTIVETEDFLNDLSFYQQPFKSNCVYFLDKSQFSLSRINLENSSLDSLATFNLKSAPVAFLIQETMEKVLFYQSERIDEYDFNGNHLNSIDLNDIIHEKGVLTVQSQFFTPIIHKEYLYMHYFPLISDAYKDSLFFQQPIEAKLNIKNKKYSFMKTSYPYNFRNNCYGFNYSPERFLMNDGEHLGYSFPYNDSIFVENFTTGETQKYFFGIRSNKPNFQYINFHEIEGLNDNVFHELFMKNPSYSFSTAFPLSGYYSRILLERNKDGDIKKTTCFFDNSFNYIGETSVNGLNGILCDSKNGIVAISADWNKNEIYLTDIKW